MTSRPRLGIFGGSFDPPHLGHLVMASEACAAARLDGVVFVPAASPPHKAGEPRTPAATRLAMTRAAVAGDARFSVSALEIERGLTFTRDTVAAFAELHPQYELAFLMGSDSLLQFEKWHDPEGILRYCSLLVALRPDDDQETVRAAAARWGEAAVELLPAPIIGIASRALRRRVAAGFTLRYLVPDAVERFIDDEGLYGAEA